MSKVVRRESGPFVLCGYRPFREARVCACGDHGFVGLNRGAVSFFDAEDINIASGIVWSIIKPSGTLPYAAAKNIGTLHGLICQADGLHVDHIDHDTLNNRRKNLRAVTASINCQNKMPKLGRSGFLGVWLRNGRFAASIRILGRRKCLGRFDRAEQAAAAYDAAAIRHYGKGAMTNQRLGLLPGQRGAPGIQPRAVRAVIAQRQ